MVPTNRFLKWAVLLTVGIISIYLIGCIVVYRIPATAEPEYFEGNVHYKLADNTGTNRQLFEELVMRNRIIHLDDKSILYVSKPEYKILWPEDPQEMHKKGYTVRTKLKAQKLLFGGYSKAMIVELEILGEAPEISE